MGSAMRGLTPGTGRIVLAELTHAAKVGTDLSAAEGQRSDRGLWGLPRFLVAIPDDTEGVGGLLEQRALPMLLEAEKLAGPMSVLWPIPGVHRTREGRPCLTIACQGWMPTAGELRALATALEGSQRLMTVAVFAMDATELQQVVPSCGV